MTQFLSTVEQQKQYMRTLGTWPHLEVYGVRAASFDERNCKTADPGYSSLFPGCSSNQLPSHHARTAPVQVFRTHHDSARAMRMNTTALYPQPALRHILAILRS